MVTRGVRRARRILTAAGMAALFVLGVLGHLLTAAAPADDTPLTVTVRAMGVDNRLCQALDPEAMLATAPWRLDEHPATLSSVVITPHIKSGFSEGRFLSYPSALLSDLTFTLHLQGERRGDSFFTEGDFFAVGEGAALCSFALSYPVTITKITE